MKSPSHRLLKKSQSRKSVRPSGKSWKKRQVQRSARKVHLQRAIDRKRALKK